MSKKQKKIIVLASMFALTFGIVPNVSAMHIMEGYLPGGFCIAWGVICVPFLIAGFMSIKKTLNEHRNLITMLAMSGAFIFVISSLDTVRHRKLLTYDRNRSRSHSLRPLFPFWD